MAQTSVASGQAYEVVLADVEARLHSGDLRVGDRLPSERALAEQFGISRASVREAVRILGTLGLIRSGVGSGPQAGAVVVSEPSAALGWGLRMHLASESLPVGDVVAVRSRLESEAAADAARAPEGPERTRALGRAQACLEAIDRPDCSDARFHEMDAVFHQALTALGGNVVASTVLDSLRQATLGYVLEGVDRLEDWPGVREELNRQHWEILHAVRDHDAEAACAAVAHHIEWFYERAFGTD